MIFLAEAVAFEPQTSPVDGRPHDRASSRPARPLTTEAV
jgi:hypothetical protein